jgi:1,4-dihydroxy-6-naphthoate synthase
MDLTVGHTPDADDAFMFYGMATGRVRSRLTIKHVVEDIETLNKRALNHELHVTAISAHALGYLDDYVILRSGGSFGLDYGPIVIAKKKMDASELGRATIAIPGKLTSANLLLMLAIGKFEAAEMSFEAIPDAVDSGRADAGLVIHEAQITYDRKKFVKVFDLGSWWAAKNAGLPVPLGINVASMRSMDRQTIQDFSELFARSIAYGLQNIGEAVDYAMQYGRGQPKETITEFVKMYVNDLTLDMGQKGRKAIERMFELAREAKLIEREVKIEVV